MIISLHVADVGARAVPALLRERLHPGEVPGLRSARTTLTGAIEAGLLPKLHPGRVALLASWEDDAALDGFLRTEQSPLAERLAGGWHVRLRPIRMSGSWSAMPVEVAPGTATDDDQGYGGQRYGEQDGQGLDGQRQASRGQDGRGLDGDGRGRDGRGLDGDGRGRDGRGLESGERHVEVVAGATATPVAVLTLGQLRLRRALPFLRANSRAAGRAAADPALLASLALARPPRFVSTFSIWQSVDAMRRYAYDSTQPDHKAAIQAHQAAPFHHEAGFVRCLPYATQGTLDGRDPLATAGSTAATAATSHRETR
ncbi:spheroidene monooxygenase [Streptomyces sp. NRRL S-1448]|uniref:spheroidene monooxygenase n=1 Tax=Streptomyces sp. NRRL S-1448 TaxID=1463883 RepID=UPI000A6C4C43|nr:spheroidene monooxygenase [Streptomyces sp. NRRL S-1448]